MNKPVASFQYNDFIRSDIESYKARPLKHLWNEFNADYIQTAWANED